MQKEIWIVKIYWTQNEGIDIGFEVHCFETEEKARAYFNQQVEGEKRFEEEEELKGIIYEHSDTTASFYREGFALDYDLEIEIEKHHFED